MNTEDPSKQLYWTHPIAEDENLSSKLIVIISPYATASAIQELFEIKPPPHGLQIITSWTSNNLASGSADPEVFKVMQKYEGRLYHHPNIHLKLYIYSANEAILSSGNLTRNGLGFSETPNIELSSYVHLNHEDWLHISNIFEESTRISQETYEAAVKFCEQHKINGPIDDFLVTPFNEIKSDLSWLSLPSTSSPINLWENYSQTDLNSSPDTQSRVRHDIELYNIPNGLNEQSFHAYLKNVFLNHPFITKLTAWIEQKGEARFGSVKQWLQENCSDKPTPYRWELTPATQALYEWLCFYNGDITWHRPYHSQVLQWIKQ